MEPGTVATEAGSIRISADELSLDYTLAPGQSFRWKQDDAGRWVGVVRRRVVRLWREPEYLRFRVLPTHADDEDLVREYLRLDLRLSDLYSDFLRADPTLVEVIERFRGLRVLRQEPEETLLSYVCSAANSVTRISASIEAMSERFGERIATVDGRDYYSFPTAAALAAADPNDLTNLCGLGFRGTNLNAVARQIVEKPEGWLESLRHADYQEARAELLGLRCVGLKIADCALLFSLGKDDAFPVDTHIRQVAVSRYLPEFRQKRLTPAVYEQIAEYFRGKFGPYAGWAQEYLFYDDLLRHPPRSRML